MKKAERDAFLKRLQKRVDREERHDRGPVMVTVSVEQK